MSDVVLVAAITGGTSVLTAGVAAVVTWRLSLNSTKVELGKIEAEDTRLLAANREEERRKRQATYHDYLDAGNRFHQLLGTEVRPADQKDLTRELNHHIMGVMLFGTGDVMHGAVEVGRVYNDIWARFEREQVESPEKPAGKQWRDATTPFAEEFGEKSGELIQLMHDDVTRGITDDSAP